MSGWDHERRFTELKTPRRVMDLVVHDLEIPHRRIQKPHRSARLSASIWDGRLSIGAARHPLISKLVGKIVTRSQHNRQQVKLPKQYRNRRGENIAHNESSKGTTMEKFTKDRDGFIKQMAGHIGLSMADLGIYNHLIKKRDKGLTADEGKEFTRLSWEIFKALTSRNFYKRSALDQEFILGMNKQGVTVENAPVYPLDKLHSLLAELHSDFA